MKHLNNSEFAKLVDVSETSIRRARQKGLVVAEADGLINPTRLENQAYRLAKQLDPQAGSIKSFKKEQAKSSPKTETIAVSKDAASLEINELRRRKELASIREKELKNDKLRGKLISRDYVSTVFNQLWAVQQSEFIPIANKIMPELASIFGIEDQEKISVARARLESELWKALGSMKRAIQEYLKVDEQ